MHQITDHAALGRFEMMEEGKLAFAEYRIEGEVMVIPHVEADPALRGRGAAGRLMEGVLSIARERGLRIRPICGYAAAYIQRNPQHRDLLA
jgi:predicted GNAT family acetyltransferase